MCDAAVGRHCDGPSCLTIVYPCHAVETFCSRECAEAFLEAR